MRRVYRIFELFGMLGGGNLALQKDSRYLQCQSCGHIRSHPSGFYGSDGLGDTSRVSLYSEGMYEQCEKCGGSMSEVHISSARVMGMGRTGHTGPGGALHGGAY